MKKKTNWWIVILLIGGILALRGELFGVRVGHPDFSSMYIHSPVSGVAQVDLVAEANMVFGVSDYVEMCTEYHGSHSPYIDWHFHHILVLKAYDRGSGSWITFDTTDFTYEWARESEHYDSSYTCLWVYGNIPTRNYGNFETVFYVSETEPETTTTVPITTVPATTTTPITTSPVTTTIKPSPPSPSPTNVLEWINNLFNAIFAWIKSLLGWT